MCSGFFPTPLISMSKEYIKDNEVILLAAASCVSRKVHVSEGGKEPTEQAI